MIGKLLTAAAGRSIARTIGGASAGPAGAVIGAAAPAMIPAIARRLGPGGMVAAAVGGMLFKRYLDRRKARHDTRTAAIAAMPPNAPQAVLGAPQKPRALEGELKRRT